MKYFKRIRLLTILKVICILMIIAFPLVSLWGKSQCHYIDLDHFFKTAGYHPDNELVLGRDAQVLDMIYPSEDKIQNLDDLIEHSEVVAIVQMKSYEFSGPDILANCIVQKVIKGNSIKENESIEIYDHLYLISVSSAEENRRLNWIQYFKDNVPLKKGDMYIVFINKAINPIKENTWMYSTYYYGNFRIKEVPSICEYSYDFENIENVLTLEKASEYDLIYNADLGPIPINEKKVQLYKEIYDRFHTFIE